MIDQICELGDVIRDVEPATRDPYRLVRRILRRKSSQDGNVTPIYVVVAETSRHFGGREEGGWWYDISTITEVRKFWDWKSAMVGIRDMRDRYPKPRHDRYSVLGGCDIDISIHSSRETFPQEQTERPRYE